MVLASVAATAARPAFAQPDAPPVAGSLADPDLQRLYDGAGWRALWTPDTRRQLAAVLDGAVRHGLDASPLVTRHADLDTAPDATVSQAALRYARALARGAVDPAKLHQVFELRRNEVDLVAGLSAALATGDLAAWFDGLAPASDDYRALSQAYLHARERAAAKPPPPIPDGPRLAPGAADPRLPAIGRRLVDQGYLAEPPQRPKAKGKGKGKGKAKDGGKDRTKPATTYAGAMVEAVKALQVEFGLPADGVIGTATVQILNGGARLRARTLAVNLERLRWLARDPPANRIDVNIATAWLTVFQDGAAGVRRRVVVGAPKHETPPLEASFSRIVVNPPWYVPESIARREIFPKGRGYMARNGMVVRAGRVIQKPGPASALGQVKFDLQDGHAIYLHDTPSKKLFSRADRHLSHGCVRVEDAVGLAEALASAAGSVADLENALAVNATRTVTLGTEIPVRLLYLTAFVEGGAVRFTPDAYGWDDAVAQGLGLGPGAPHKAAAASADLGP